MFPRWLSWVFLCAMGYIIYSASQQSKPVTTLQPVQPVITEHTYPALAEMMDGERWKRKLDPDYAAQRNCTLDAPAVQNGLALSVLEILPGEGAGAACGDTITLHLTVWNKAGEKAYNATLTLALGSRELASGLDSGLLGIKPEGKRTLILPPYALSRSQSSRGHEAARHALPAARMAVVTLTRVK